MCLNGWGGRLHEALLPFLADARPDVLCLQEVVHTPGAEKDWLTYRDHGVELAQRADFFGDVRRALPEHIAIFCPASRGELWDGEKCYASQWGLATFIHRRFPIIAQMQGFVHGAFSPHGYGAHPRPRNAHAVRLFDFERARPITIAHMHGLRELSGKHDTPERRHQAERFADLIQAVAGADDPLVACGDFNVTPDSETFGILGRLGLSDLVTGRGFADTRTSYYAKPGRFADYLLVSPQLQNARFEVLDQPEVSDHRPLVLHID